MQRVDISRHMARYIKARRKELRLSLQEVADRAGITKSHCWELEQDGRKNPTILTSMALCNALQCSLNSLLGFDAAQPALTDQELALVAAHRQIFNQKGSE